MKKALSRLFVGFCLVALMITLVPFHIAHAEDINTTLSTNNIVGYQIEYDTKVIVDPNSQTTSQLYDNHITIVFDDYYIGKIQRLKVVYNSSGNTFTFNNIGVNGTYIKVTIPQQVNRIILSNVSISEMTVTYATRQIDFLQMFPFESFSIQAFNLANNPLAGINEMYGYKFNMFELNTNDSEGSFSGYPMMHQFYTYSQQRYYWIFWIDKNIYANHYNEYIGLGNNVAYIDCEVINRFHYEGHTTSLVKMTIEGMRNAGNTIQYINTSEKALYMPIYFNTIEYQSISTDFALQFNLNNRLLNDLDNLGGTQSSDQSANNLDNETSNMIDDQENLFSYEDDFNDSMNDALDDIDVNFNIGNTLGSKFLASASWVRQQFDALTSTSPFGSVLSFSLLLGLALLIIGKAVK